MRKVKLVVVTITVSVLMAATALAGEWKQDETGWQYQNDDGACARSSWQWIDGNNDGVSENYCFDASGYCFMNTITPDGYTVDASGAWVVDGIVQTKAAETSALAANAVDTTQVATQAASAQQPSWNAAYPYVDGMTSDSTNSNYVVNTNTGKVHKPSCSSVKDMKSNNTQYFNGNFSSLTGAGYSSCGRCRVK